MTQSIADQVASNRRLLLSLPTHCNFVNVWVPELLTYQLRCVYQVLDTGTDIQNPGVTVINDQRARPRSFI